MKCKSCGARIRSGDVRCPYCSHLNEPAADKSYMSKLGELHAGMERLSLQPKRTLKQEMMRMFLITTAAMVVAVASGFLIDYVMMGSSVAETGTQDKRVKVQIAWEEKNFPVMDSLYEAGDYEKLLEMYQADYAESSRFSRWEHISLLLAYEYFAQVKNLRQRVEEEKQIANYDITRALEGGLRLLFEYPQDTADGKEAEEIKKMAEEAEAILSEYLHIPSEEMEELYLSFLEGGYFSYLTCREYAIELEKALFSE